ncbi:hypothetical protein B0A48_08397 [Cryoendolithus antarcticus]|uniref:Adenosine deaminase domain-containing protein n=1 Tax=Cryoendolithus antarcticus TaxID=1507870 RepID=A0A1V8T618_9PEZI|nr:hypothetical protein B0A48_08397 [Cryoendolithus antarcticus]
MSKQLRIVTVRDAEEWQVRTAPVSLPDRSRTTMLRRLRKRRADVDSRDGESNQKRVDSLLVDESSPTKPTKRSASRKFIKTFKPSNPLPFSMQTTSITMQANGMQDLGAQVHEALSNCIGETGQNEEYRHQRDQLLTDEGRDSWESNVRDRASLSQGRAAIIVRKIREKERNDPEIFGNLPGEAVPGPRTHDLGGRYLKNYASIKRSKVYEIAKKAPKGAHLHLHFNSELPARTLFPIARTIPETMYIRSTCALISEEALSDCEITFNVLPKGAASGNIFENAYNPDFKQAPPSAYMLWRDFKIEFIHRFPHSVPPAEYEDALEPPERWARNKMVITEDLKYKKAQTHNEMWACFNQGTRAFKGLVNYASVYREYVGMAIVRMIRHKVMYAELRPMMLDKTIPTDDGTGFLDHKAQMNIILEVVKVKQDELRAAGKLEHFPFGMKIIYCTPRSIPRERMKLELEDCIKLALQFKEQKLICGFDLVGAEDRPNNVSFYADLLVAFKKTCKSLELDIPFMFHAGETLLDTGGSKDPRNSNLYDSLLLGAKRIGHGYALVKHPLLIEKYKKSNIALELCPISNELLGLCGNAREHPYPALLAAGLHCTLNADNPALFRSSISHEFYQVMVGDPRMTLHGWKQLAEWSLEHACLTESEVARGLRILRADWEIYCQWIVDTYGAEADAEED